MDYLGYRLDWRQEEEGEKIPTKRILAAAMQWDLEEGGHPMLLSAPKAFYEREPFKDTRKPYVSMEFQIRPMGCVHGHNTLADNAITSLLDIDRNVPVSPLFVRDLCGRTIYLGYGPEAKAIDEWNSYSASYRDSKGDYPNGHVPRITFPRNCCVADEAMEGHDLIENVFFCKFRTLDMSFEYAAEAAGEEGKLSASFYQNANLYPYKLRLDTYYTDGFKLPQTQMVFAKQDVLPQQAQSAADQLMHKWKERLPDQNYATFIETVFGDDGVENLFSRGCTIIPTFEACNGFNVVGREFDLKDYWPGKAVPGLHEVMEDRKSDAPAGTILEVIEPGYVTAFDVMPAKVIISNGEDYLSPNGYDPEPMIPNLNLPHQRTVTQWGMCWIPTHPMHFEIPAMWGWEPQSGRFLQLTGPLWDPLHYHYECTDIVIKAFETPMEENRWLVSVPEEMETRFYPVVEMKGFDTLSLVESNRRYESKILPRSGAKRVLENKVSSPVGYHPLPPQFEYEMAPFWFPTMHPFNRLDDDCPENLRNFIIPVIESNITPREYTETVVGPKEADWLTNTQIMVPTQKDTLLDYSFLLRYVDEELSDEEIFTMAQGLFLESVNIDYLHATPSERWDGVDSFEDLESIQSGMFDSVWEVRERALRVLQLRYDLYTKNPALYAYAWWMCIPAPTLQTFFKEWEDKNKPLVSSSINASVPLGARVGAAVSSHSSKERGAHHLKLPKLPEPEVDK